MSERSSNLQTISWFADIYKRNRLDLDPPYQRRSVWNQAFKDYFIDTILLQYPAPAIFLYQEILPDGQTFYHVVDGKQRLTTIFGFIDNEFPVSEIAEDTENRSKYFKELDDEKKREFWSYQFSVEYIQTNDESIINNVFDRINRNTKRLSQQELRHAQFDGEFIRAAEDLAEWLQKKLPYGLPTIAGGQKRQMKDVELVAQLLLLIEEGPTGHKPEQLDKAFSERDDDWSDKTNIEASFQTIIEFIKKLAEENDNFKRSRLRNQADFYSLVGAIKLLADEGSLPEPIDAVTNLLTFIESVDNENTRADNVIAEDYYKAARYSSSHIGSRKRRIEILKSVISDGG